jgi:hypothetical protein
LRWQGLELITLKTVQKMNKEQNVEGLNVSPAIAKPMLNEVPSFVVEDRHEAYCPKCEVYLVWQQVTNDEKHCLCDTEVEWHPVGQ